ncbi:probable DEAD-box ATP-dependent RNA helicase 48 [Impatiens glandulifera]|uniref:probable DEAD-box ATP-dependent RNA helicase 48 n=1 Tax=Impatiens glandulifera TaxID=253017 RepID=UPI001FB08EB7|nr:probable DEAD-box ATP-dependent RNA helicase 48 [Impatiens glandulifera]
MLSSKLLQDHSRISLKRLCSIVFVRLMGGGPRTFPGGLSKWQWKRLHEKKSREKEKKLLDQEKQLYQARIRSQIRSKLDGEPNGIGAHQDPNHGPMTARDQVKALADRFMKEGAEDLWNEADGPIKTPLPCPTVLPGPRLAQRPIGIRNLSSPYFNGPRHYSVYSPRQISNGSDLTVKSGKKTWPRLGSRRDESSDDECTDDEMGKDIGGRGGRMMSNAALGMYDRKTKKRLPLNSLENEENLSEHVEYIREEFNKRKMMERSQVFNEEESILSQKKFEECDVSPLTVKALTEAGFVQMTRVQEATISVGLEGNDALVKAKTGTGKTAAFLIPAIETVLKASATPNTRLRVLPIYVLVLCPTRELASQIAAEANAMMRYHEGIGVQTLVGGTRFKLDQKRLESEPCQIIVATPGRLLDHIENKSGFSVRLMQLKMLILDEADHLLDLGFRKDVERIVDCVPRQRQSFMFSATLPKEVRRVSQLVLKREHAYIDTVGLGRLETHAKVKQSYLVAPHDQHFQITHHLLKEHISVTPDYKVVVFCSTAMVTSLMFLLLKEMKLNVREMHSRKTQLYRDRATEEFKESKRLILVTSDVSARGMNYPDVTLVIQVGIPSDREQYIHRLGRTGREGKEGEGVLLIAPWEQYFLSEIKDLPLEKVSLPEIDPNIKLKMNESMAKVDNSVKEAAYHAWLGYYNSIRETGRDKTTLVELANQFSNSIGLEKPPGLFRKTALKMGLKDIPGIKIRK